MIFAISQEILVSMLMLLGISKIMKLLTKSNSKGDQNVRFDFFVNSIQNNLIYVNLLGLFLELLPLIFQMLNIRWLK